MAYEAHKWKIGEEITSDKLNHIEKGIEEAGLPREITDPQDGQTLKYDAASGKWVNGEASGGTTEPLIVNQTTTEVDGTSAQLLDKTWKEIHDAYVSGRPVYIEDPTDNYQQVVNIYRTDADDVIFEVFTINAIISDNSYYTEDENGYPVQLNQV